MQAPGLRVFASDVEAVDAGRVAEDDLLPIVVGQPFERTGDDLPRMRKRPLVGREFVCAGAPVRALLLTTPPDRIWRAIGTLPEALAMPGALRKGIG